MKQGKIFFIELSSFSNLFLPDCIQKSEITQNLRGFQSISKKIYSNELEFFKGHSFLINSKYSVSVKGICEQKGWK